jgi:hypothetical protein
MRRPHLAGHGHRVKGKRRDVQSPDLITDMSINLLKLLDHFAPSEFHCGKKHASLMREES